jgi:hypothetical protein
MKLNTKQMQQLMSYFPKIELSYIKNIHKKVHSDVYLIIPKGLKFFAWFKCWNNQNVCFFMQVDPRTKSIKNIKIFPCVFDYSLCAGKGTVLYGTIINKKTNIFCIEDIFYYKNKNINFNNLQNKLTYLEKMFEKDLKQIVYKKNDVLFTLPIMSNNFNKILKDANLTSYDIYCIQSRQLYKNTPYLNYRIKIQKEIYATFTIKTCIDEDIYELYYYSNENKMKKYNYAYIPDYKTSIYMNSLFRNIRENINLDYIEESEDEETFEDISLDKYVDLEKKINIKCKYVPKMKMWKPLKIDDSKVASEKFINMIEK